MLRNRFDYSKVGNNLNIILLAIVTYCISEQLQIDHNHDTCDACGEEGKFLCCDACPASFHFGCVDPPVSPDAVPDGDWYCNQCSHAKVTSSSDM